MREYTTAEDGELLCEMNLGDNYICDAINDGLPLSCVVSTDNFLLHSAELYKRSVLISPVPENGAVLDKLSELSERGIGVLVYGTEKKLSAVQDGRIFKLDIAAGASRLREAIADFGFSISFVKKSEGVKPPTVAIARRDNALFFSVYNSNTTTEARFKFPLGAPVLCGMETEMVGGSSSYRFGRGEHRECRVFVEQDSGVISCREAPPVNAHYRRAIKITGLSDATVRLFPEAGCEAIVSTAKMTDDTPVLDTRFRAVSDDNGEYLLGEHITGNIYFLMGRRSL